MVRLGILLAFALALMLAGGVATLGGTQSGTRSLAPVVAPAGPTQMLVSEGGRAESSRLLPVDPLTLTDLSPQSATAKVPPIGTTVRAAFAADGRHLYVWGLETELDDEGTVTMLNLPLRLIDTDGGILVSETEAGSFPAVFPAADGSALYTVSMGEPDDGANPPVLLRRLDPVTLAIEAEHTFPGYPRVILRPSLPSGSDG